jgi:hypothetical protein
VPDKSKSQYEPLRVEVEPAYHAPTPFDIEEVNKTLDKLAIAHQGRSFELAAPVVAVVNSMLNTLVQQQVELGAAYEQLVDHDADGPQPDTRDVVARAREVRDQLAA